MVDHQEGKKKTDTIRMRLVAHALGTGAYIAGGTFKNDKACQQGCLSSTLSNATTRNGTAVGLLSSGDEKPTKSGHNGLEWSVEMLSSQEHRAIKSPLQLAHLRGEDRLDLEEVEFALMGESIAASPGVQ